MEEKPWYLSKVIWLSLFTFVAGVLSNFNIVVEPETLADSILAIVTAVTALLTIVARLFSTTKKLTK